MPAPLCGSRLFESSRASRTRSRRVALSRLIATEEFLSIRIDDARLFRKRHIGLSVLQPAADDRNLVAFLEGGVGPAPALQYGRRTQLSAPSHGFTFGVFRLDNDDRVGV